MPCFQIVLFFPRPWKSEQTNLAWGRKGSFMQFLKEPVKVLIFFWIPLSPPPPPALMSCKEKLQRLGGNDWLENRGKFRCEMASQWAFCDISVWNFQQEDHWRRNTQQTSGPRLSPPVFLGAQAELMAPGTEVPSSFPLYFWSQCQWHSSLFSFLFNSSVVWGFQYLFTYFSKLSFEILRKGAAFSLLCSDGSQPRDRESRGANKMQLDN